MSEAKPKRRWLYRTANLVVPMGPLRGLRQRGSRSGWTIRHALGYLWYRIQQARQAPKAQARFPDAAETAVLTRNARIVWCAGLALCGVSAGLIVVARHASSTMIAINALIAALGLATMGLVYAADAARLVHTLRLGREIGWAEYFDARHCRWWIPF